MELLRLLLQLPALLHRPLLGRLGVLLAPLQLAHLLLQLGRLLFLLRRGLLSLAQLSLKLRIAASLLAKLPFLLLHPAAQLTGLLLLPQQGGFQLLRLSGKLTLLVLELLLLLLQRLIHVLLLGEQILKDGIFLKQHGFFLFRILQFVLQLLHPDRFLGHAHGRQDSQPRRVQVRIGQRDAAHMFIHAARHLLHIFRAAANDFIRSSVDFHVYANSALIVQRYVPPSVLCVVS
ncbi:hypothetical protein D3C76_1226300 [compost metagenome]